MSYKKLFSTKTFKENETLLDTVEVIISCKAFLRCPPRDLFRVSNLLNTDQMSVNECDNVRTYSICSRHIK